MANAQVGGRVVGGYVDKRMVQGNDGDLYGTVDTSSNYNTIENMRARLTAINGTYYTSTRLDDMTANDMVYAIRLNDDAGSI